MPTAPRLVRGKLGVRTQVSWLRGSQLHPCPQGQESREVLCALWLACSTPFILSCKSLKAEQAGTLYSRAGATRWEVTRLPRPRFPLLKTVRPHPSGW